MEITQDIFYDISKLSLEKKTELFTEAYNKNTFFRCDFLDCNVSWARQTIANADFKKYIKLLTNKSHCVFIIRKPRLLDEEPYIETGFSTLVNTPDYFMFIYLDIKDLSYFVEKYKLEKRYQ